MNLQAQSLTPITYFLNKCCIKKLSSKTLVTARKPFNVGEKNLWSEKMKIQTAVLGVPEGQNFMTDKPKREVVEHITLVKAKEDLSDEEEKDMLDYLYTCQYQMRGIVAISLGRILNQNSENYTHAIFMRFQKKENLANFYENPFYLEVIRDHVSPYCHEFNYGVEFVLLIAFSESSLDSVEDALASLAKLMMDFPSLIVQSTQGLNFNSGSKEFSHVAFVRFRSSEAFEIFAGSSEYKDIWRSKLQPLIQKVISVTYSVDPVGTEVM